MNEWMHDDDDDSDDDLNMFTDIQTSKEFIQNDIRWESCCTAMLILKLMITTMMTMMQTIITATPPDKKYNINNNNEGTYALKNDLIKTSLASDQEWSRLTQGRNLHDPEHLCRALHLVSPQKVRSSRRIKACVVDLTRLVRCATLKIHAMQFWKVKMEDGIKR